MPEIGKIERACDVGKSGKTLLVWAACAVCGKERWTPRVRGHELCVSCAAKTRAREERPITYTGEGTPKIGDITTATVLGLSGFMFMYYDPCVKCGSPHWVRKTSKGTYCRRCAPKSIGHRQGRESCAKYTTSGYVYVYVEKEDPMRPMAKKDGWVLEHRLVVARRIGRPLTRVEVVHHVNGIRHDNRDSNLQLLTRETHHSYLGTYEKQNRIRDLESRVTALEAENVLLRKQLADIANPEPSREDNYNLLGVCRDLTGDTLQCEGEGKVHPSGKPEDECGKCRDRGSCIRGYRFPYNEHQLYVKLGVPAEQSAGKQTAKSGEPKSVIGYGNPELAGDNLRASAETLHGLPYTGKEKVHSSEKSLGESASREPIPAALTKWRCINLPKRGTLNTDK